MNNIKQLNKLWLIPLILFILFLLLCLIPQVTFQIKYGGMPIAAQTGGFAPDCLWSGTAVAWIDKNQNGQFDADEQPLPDVAFHITNGNDSISNWKGEAPLSVWLPGCPEANFDISPEVPSGYHSTTAPKLPSTARESNKIYKFGFNTLSGVPTATAYPPAPVCKSYQIGIYNQSNVTDIAVAADGSVWASTAGNGVVHYIPQQDGWIRYKTNDGLISNTISSITALNNGNIWFAAQGGASMWNGSKWLSYTDKDGLINDEVFKIAEAPDHSLWFGTLEGASHFFPDKGIWTNYTVKDGLVDNFVKNISITPDNSVWFFTATEGISRLISSASDSKTQKWITYTYDKDSTEGTAFPLDFFDKIEIAPDGIYWLSSFEGFIRFDPKTETWELDKTYSKNNGYVKSFTFGQDGTIWVASGSSSPIIYHLNRQNIWEIYDNRDGLPIIDKDNVDGNGAVGVAVDFNNNIWVATSESATQCVFSKNR